LAEIAGRGFDPANAAAEADRNCQQDVVASKAMLGLADLLADYHDALLRTAGGEVAASLDGNYDKLAAAVGAVAVPGKFAVSAEQLTAVTSVVKWVSGQALAAKQSGEIRTALARHGDVSLVADVLVRYVRYNYRGYLDQSIGQIEATLQNLPPAVAGNPFGENLLRRELYSKRAELIAKRALSDVFIAAIGKMQLALDALAQSGGKPGSEAQIKSLMLAAQEARKLKRDWLLAFH
jgi:hypothetical protein